MSSGSQSASEANAGDEGRDAGLVRALLAAGSVAGGPAPEGGEGCAPGGGVEDGLEVGPGPGDQDDEPERRGHRRSRQASRSTASTAPSSSQPKRVTVR